MNEIVAVEREIPSEIEIPESQIVLVQHGQLHPSTKVFLCCSVEGQLVTPIVSFRQPNDHGDSLDLEFEAIGINSLDCKLDFKEDVAPFFIADDEEFKRVLALRALHTNLHQLRFSLNWRRHLRECFAVGSCFLNFRNGPLLMHPVSMYLSKEPEASEEAMRLAVYFSLLREE
jgi:hypothetical protein